MSVAAFHGGDKKMKKKSGTTRTFFIADLHLGHANCLRFDNRPWETVEEMDEEIIRRWNRKVGKNDHVYVLGDFAYKNRTPVSDYTGRMNGYIHLIRGNHDKRSEEYEGCFHEVADYKDIVVMADGVKCRLILSHYFMPFYNGARHMAFALHGHTHMSGESAMEERIKEEIRRSGLRCESYNVGAMWQDYEPQTLEEIVTRQGREISFI